jgi:cytochrome c oxidase assembly protein subunit 15
VTGRATTAQALPITARNPASADRAVALWLAACCAMIFAMAVIGAITRLTESGLSIMEWAPLGGAVPPLSTAEWERLFALYRQIPEYQEINRGMSLGEFQTIFWWEYVHRLWGRLIGVAFLVPFLVLLWRGLIRRSLVPQLVAMFVLGGLQGALGWYMVESGFAERTDVSQYRLAAHLALALAIYGYMVWVAAGLLRPAPAPAADRRVPALRRATAALLALVAVTIVSGALVAGLNAGLTYNTFPLMDGRLVPEGYGALSPFWVNWGENVAAVQLDHRVLAVTTVLASLALAAWSTRCALERRTRRAYGLLAAAALAQLGLGIATLLLVVPVWLGALHQAGAILVLTAVLWTLRQVPARTASA